MDKRFESLPPKDIQIANKHILKNLNIISHEENANYSHNEQLLYTY